MFVILKIKFKKGKDKKRMWAGLQYHEEPQGEEEEHQLMV